MSVLLRDMRKEENERGCILWVNMYIIIEIVTTSYT